MENNDADKKAERRENRLLRNEAMRRWAAVEKSILERFEWKAMYALVQADLDRLGASEDPDAAELQVLDTLELKELLYQKDVPSARVRKIVANIIHRARLITAVPAPRIRALGGPSEKKK